MTIEVVEKDQAAESVKPIYDKLAGKTGGRVINFFKMMAHKPNILGPFADFYSQVWAPAGALSLKIREFAYLRTSLMNGCEY
jgi:alkylhydroperoxidase family enzyme